MISATPRRVALMLVAAWGVSGLTRPLERGIATVTAVGESRTEQLTAVADQGGLLAVLGGLRSVVASGCWLRANLAWEKSDLAETTRLLDCTVAADERPLYFWLNGARILANDLPEWRLRGPVPTALRSRVNEEQAQAALRFLERGVRWHGADPALFAEMAHIHLRRRGDRESAARFYRLAAEQPGAPYYAARIYAELLQQLGRPEEALAWLRKILPTLPEGDLQARRGVVVERIEELERGVAAANVF
jgi:hypothetical protein